MWRVGDYLVSEAAPVALGLLQRSVAKMVLLRRPSLSTPMVIELEKRDVPVRSGMLPLQSRVQILTILLRFKGHHVFCVTGGEEIHAVIEKTRMLRKDNCIHIASLAAISTAIRRQGLVAAGSSWITVQTLPPKDPKHEDFLYSAAPVPQVELIENSKTAFTTILDAQKAVCFLDHADVWGLTELHEMNT